VPITGCRNEQLAGIASQPDDNVRGKIEEVFDELRHRDNDLDVTLQPPPAPDRPGAQHHQRVCITFEGSKNCSSS